MTDPMQDVLVEALLLVHSWERDTAEREAYDLAATEPMQAIARRLQAEQRIDPGPIKTIEVNEGER